MFEKTPGRPPEDRVQRRREIWEAVSPLIEEIGARKLTMRQAAAASYMSLGGLYHYFADKRALVLFGLNQEALQRSCEEFKAEVVELRARDPGGAAEAFISFFAGEVTFVRPAVLAALELGAAEFLATLERSLNMGLANFVQTLRLSVPDVADRDLPNVARSIRRIVFAGALDRSITRTEIEAELRALLGGIPVTSQLADRQVPA